MGFEGIFFRRTWQTKNITWKWGFGFLGPKTAVSWLFLFSVIFRVLLKPFLQCFWESLVARFKRQFLSKKSSFFAHKTLLKNLLLFSDNWKEPFLLVFRCFVLFCSFVLSCIFESAYTTPHTKNKKHDFLWETVTLLISHCLPHLCFCPCLSLPCLFLSVPFVLSCFLSFSFSFLFSFSFFLASWLCIYFSCFDASIHQQDKK